MVESTVRRKLKKLGLNLKVSTEKYTGDKCYAVVENGKTIMNHQTLDELIDTWKSDLDMAYFK